MKGGIYGSCEESHNDCIGQCPGCGQLIYAPGHMGPVSSLVGTCNHWHYGEKYHISGIVLLHSDDAFRFPDSVGMQWRYSEIWIFFPRIQGDGRSGIWSDIRWAIRTQRNFRYYSTRVENHCLFRKSGRRQDNASLWQGERRGANAYSELWAGSQGTSFRLEH